MKNKLFEMIGNIIKNNDVGEDVFFQIPDKGYILNFEELYNILSAKEVVKISERTDFRFYTTEYRVYDKNGVFFIITLV